MKSTTSLAALLLSAAILPGAIAQWDNQAAACTYDCLLASATMCVNDTDDIYRCMCSRAYLTPVSRCMVNTCPSSTLRSSWAGIQSECKVAGFSVGDMSSYTGSTVPSTTRGPSGSTPTSDASRESDEPFDGPGFNGGDGNNGSSEKKGISTAAIIGIVVGGVAAIAIIAGLIVFCIKHKAKQNRRKAESAVVANIPPAMVDQGQQQPPYYPPQDPAANYQQQAQQPLMQHQYVPQQPQQQPQHQQVAGGAGGYYMPNLKEGAPMGNTGHVQELGGSSIPATKEGYYPSTGQEAVATPIAPPPPQYTAATLQHIQSAQQQETTQQPPHPQQAGIGIYQELPAQQQTERVEIGPSR